MLTGVERNGESGDVTALVFEDGQRLEGDFFIDATGFRKRLIVGEMQAPWISYQHELPVNRALPFWLPVEEGDEIANYTRAWAQEAGWMWQIPTQYRYGCGYVYSDEFRTPDEAHAEVERVLGRKIEVRGDIQFKIGRLEKAWINNVVAVGLSSSFLEPLESTSIHGTIVQMMMFAGQYLREPGKMTQALRDDYNRRVGRQVDDFRTFVNTHYMTERDDTPFWREVREHRIHPETKERLARWKTRDAAARALSGVSVRAAAYRNAAALSGARRAGAARPGAGQGRDGPRPQAQEVRARDARQPREGVQAGCHQGARARGVPGGGARDGMRRAGRPASQTGSIT